MNQLKVWHGTLTSGISDFLPLTHFGTKLQACRAILAQAALDKKTGSPTLYKCKLSFTKTEVQYLDDSGSPFYQAIYRSYCYSIHEENTFREKFRESNDKGGLGRDNEQWLNWLIELASSQGHKLLSYNNKVEGPGMSYCIIDLNSITDIVSISLTWEEIAKKHSSASSAEHGYNKDDSQIMNEFLDKMND